MREFLKKCKFFFVYAGLFSFFINLLLLVSPLYVMQLFDRVLGSRSDSTLLMLTLVALFALIVMAMLEMLRSRLLVRAGVALENILSQPALAELIRNAARPGGNSYSYAMRDINMLRGFLSSSGILAFFDAPWSPLFVVLIYIFHPVFGLVATLGIAVLFTLAITDEKITGTLLDQAKSKGRNSGAFAETAVRNAEVIYAMGMIPAAVQRWRALNDEALEQQTLASNRSGTIVSATKFVTFSLSIIMMAIGAYLIIDLHVTPGIMIAATLILGRALSPVQAAIGGWKNMIEARNAYGRLKKMMDATKNREPPLPLPAPDGRLSVEKVVFARIVTNPILKGVSFDLEAGESLGLIGPSAAGKSTLARVIMGIWPPLAGAVRLDGANIAEWDRDLLARYVGYLPQDVELFTGTVAENIARLKDPATCTEEVIEAAKRAMVHDLILHLPDGYDTDIGSAATVLSGGQRQRIALARALFGNPRLVVLDEPNSNLDTDGEAALMQAMEKLKEERVTLIVVTHRPNILTNIDKMLLLREGRVDMFGPRQEVMARLSRSGVLPLNQPRPQAIGS